MRCVTLADAFKHVAPLLGYAREDKAHEMVALVFSELGAGLRPSTYRKAIERLDRWAASLDGELPE